MSATLVRYDWQDAVDRALGVGRGDHARHDDAGWSEADHPRDKDGKFTDGGGSGTTASAGTSPSTLKKIANSPEALDVLSKTSHELGVELMGTVSAEAKAAKGAIGTWTDPKGYKKINNHVKGVAMSIEAGQLAGELQTAIKSQSLPESVHAYRGVHGPQWEHINTLAAGDEWTQAGFVATTLDPKRATHYAKGGESGDLIHMVLPAGANGLYVSHPELNSWTAEREMLLPDNSTFKYAGFEYVEMPKYDYSGNKTGEMGKVKLHHVELVNPNAAAVEPAALPPSDASAGGAPAKPHLVGLQGQDADAVETMGVTDKVSHENKIATLKVVANAWPTGSAINKYAVAMMAHLEGMEPGDPAFEALHPRDANGHFIAGAGKGEGPAAVPPGGPGDPAAAAAGVADPPGWIGKSGKLAKEVAINGLQAGWGAEPIAQAIKNAAAQHSHPHSATYANNLIGYVESQYGLPKGSLGKAAPKGQSATPANTVALAMSQAVSPVSAPAPMKAQAPVPPPPAPAAPPVAAKTVEQITSAPTAPKTPLPLPSEGKGSMALAMFNIATNVGYDGIGKLLDYAPKTAANKAYQKKLVAVLMTMKPAGAADPIDTSPGGTMLGMAAAVSGPEPFAGSKAQEAIHKIATGPLSNADKIALIKGNQTVIDYPMGKAAEFAGAWVKALGGEMSPPHSYAAASAASVAAAKPNTGAAAQTTNKMRLARAGKLKAVAADVPNCADPVAKKIAKSLSRPWWSKVDSATREACVAYKGSSGSINDVLRKGKPEPTYEHVQEQINLIDELFEHEDAKLTADVMLRRGENIDDKEIEEMKAGLAAGIPVRPQRKGFTSTSMASQAAFSKNCTYEIIARKGTPALGLWAASTTFKGENEVLLRHGSVFEVYEIEKVGYRHIIRCMTL